MTVVIRRSHLVAGLLLGTALALVAYTTLTSGSRTTPPGRPVDAAPNITALLPIPPGQLAAVADLARRFVTAYGSYRYDQTPDAYLTPLRPLTDDTLYQQLARTAADPAVLADRHAHHMSATADAQVTAVQDLQSRAVILAVTGRQHLLRDGTASTDTQAFTVTATRTNDPGEADGSARDWRISALTPVADGQPGDQP
ncbi:VirB8/TrbF family protein [Actinomadura rupiterrae]|uniref:VirB8/TrbF family protein n=1 Tax=Actinomadura rupiterrae TaxID=559627 RepID=UPI0020A42EAC|nr:VirB8/TrbF family protein [Actinomadura rupiterrae]MCP2341169.1 hypothetical protein [Actinomadura rupiterrae]